MEAFENLEIWKKAHQFVLDVYKLSSQFPKEETYGLTSQFRRAAVSIPANIAEGYPKFSKKDKARFYEIAKASLSECSYFIILSNDLNYADTKQLKIQSTEINKMLTTYLKKLRNDTN